MNNPIGEFVEVRGNGRVFSGEKQSRSGSERRTYQYMKNHKKKIEHAPRPMLVTKNASKNPPKTIYYDGSDSDEDRFESTDNGKTRFIH